MSAISRSRCGLVIDDSDLGVGFMGRSWIQGNRYKGSSLVDEFPSIHLIPPQSTCHLNVPSPLSLLLLSPLFVSSMNVFSNVQLLDITFGDICMCHDFHPFFTYFFLSSKHPNARSNHNMALSYLILSYLLFSFHNSKSHEEDRESG